MDRVQFLVDTFLHCIEYARIRVSENSYSRMFYAVLNSNINDFLINLITRNILV